MTFPEFKQVAEDAGLKVIDKGGYMSAQKPGEVSSVNYYRTTYYILTKGTPAQAIAGYQKYIAASPDAGVAPEAVASRSPAESQDADGAATETAAPPDEVELTPSASMDAGGAAFTVVPCAPPTTITECPPGLFIFKIDSDEPCIGIKTQYGAFNPHDLEVYIAENGDCFWGGTDSKAQRGDLRVVPAKLEATK